MEKNYPQSTRLLSEAIKLHKQKGYVDAEKIYEQVITAGPLGR